VKKAIIAKSMGRATEHLRLLRMYDENGFHKYGNSPCPLEISYAPPNESNQCLSICIRREYHHEPCWLAWLPAWILSRGCSVQPCVPRPNTSPASFPPATPCTKHALPPLSSTRYPSLVRATRHSLSIDPKPAKHPSSVLPIPSCMRAQRGPAA
jgi:hypothetical protein